MIPLFKKITLALCMVSIVLALNGCGKTEPEETTPATLEPIVLPTAPKETEATVAQELLDEHLSVVMDAGDLYTLDYYPNLKTVDLTGSTCYHAILDFASKRPHLDVTYTVSLGATDISNKAESATLKPGSFDYDLMMENLRYLPALTTLTLTDVELSAEQLDALRAAYPEIKLDYAVELFGSNFGVDTTNLDLSAMGSSNVKKPAGNCQK